MHLTDEDLILAADGELDVLRAAKVRDHLDACWSCRTRQAELQQAVTDFMRAYRSGLDYRLPPHAGPRALLKAQMEQRAGGVAGPVPYRKAFAGALIAASITAILFSISLFRMPHDLSKPKNTLTPGETRAVTIDDVCRVQKPRDEGRSLYVPVSLQQKVFSEYGIRDARPNAYEVDYLITPELGGADSIRNLWPEPYSIVWNARVKDDLEDRLHDLVCEGKLDLATAQREISTDWIAAYKKYFHTDRPL
jgi:hypothetical protein